MKILVGVGIIILLSLFILGNEAGITGLSIEPITYYENTAFIEEEVIEEVNYIGEVPVIILLKEQESLDGITGMAIQEIKLSNNISIQALQNEVLEDLKIEPNTIEKIFNLKANLDLELQHKYNTVPALSGILSTEGLTKLMTNPNVKANY